MSWSYSGNPANSPLDALRFLLGDTDPNEPIMTDEELQYLIDEFGDNPNLLYYQSFIRIATVFARSIKRSLGPQSEDPTKRLEYFWKMAQQYEDLINASGISQPCYASPKIFSKGMMNNPPWRPRFRKWGGPLV